MTKVKINDEKECDLIVRMKFGSHLYGTNNEDSDQDFKGIFMPDKKDIFLQKVRSGFRFDSKKDKSKKNNIDDIDVEYYSLHKFIELACQGETSALDMLHAPKNMITHTSEIWEDLVSKRHLFYTRNLKSYVGYARRQAAKYGLKGSRLSDCVNVIIFLEQFLHKKSKLTKFWDFLPKGEHLFKFDKKDIREYQVCGMSIQETVTIEYALDMLNNFYKKYGHRAKLAEKNEGIDWKAISHALRAAYQIRQILIYKTIIYPLKQAEFLKKVKSGKLNYVKDVIPVLEKLMEEIDNLSLNSDLPNEVDKKFWDNWLFKKIEENYITTNNTKVTNITILV